MCMSILGARQVWWKTHICLIQITSMTMPFLDFDVNRYFSKLTREHNHVCLYVRKGKSRSARDKGRAKREKAVGEKMVRGVELHSTDDHPRPRTHTQPNPHLPHPEWTEDSLCLPTDHQCLFFTVWIFFLHKETQVFPYMFKIPLESQRENLEKDMHV